MRTLPLPQVRGAKLGRREYSPCRGILVDTRLRPFHTVSEGKFSEVRTVPVLCAARLCCARSTAWSCLAASGNSPPLRAVRTLYFVALFANVPVTAAYLPHLGRLLPPALGVAFYPHVQEPLGTSVAAALATFETALESSASTHIQCPSLWLSVRNSTRGMRKLTCSTAQSTSEEAALKEDFPNFSITEFSEVRSRVMPALGQAC